MRVFREFLVKRVLPLKYRDFIEYAKSKNIEVVEVNGEFFLKNGYALKGVKED